MPLQALGGVVARSPLAQLRDPRLLAQLSSHVPLPLFPERPSTGPAAKLSPCFLAPCLHATACLHVGFQPAGQGPPPPCMRCRGTAAGGGCDRGLSPTPRTRTESLRRLWAQAVSAACQLVNLCVTVAMGPSACPQHLCRHKLLGLCLAAFMQRRHNAAGPCLAAFMTASQLPPRPPREPCRS